MTGRERLQYLAGVWAKWIGPWDDRDRYHELGKATFEALAHGDELVTLRSRLAAVEAERDAARAGEARAVEACQRIEEALQGTDFADHGLDSPVWNALELVRDVTADEPALDWLAQQRQEAAAEELESVRFGWLSENDYGLGVPEIWRYIANRAAALRAGEAGNE